MKKSAVAVTKVLLVAYLLQVTLSSTADDAITPPTHAEVTGGHTLKKEPNALALDESPGDSVAKDGHLDKDRGHAPPSHGHHGNDTDDVAGEHGDHGNDTAHAHGIHVASWKWDYVREPFVITLFLIIVAICKLGFHHAGTLPNIFPESCLLIVLGTLVGLILYFTKFKLFPSLQPEGFFLYLLPPYAKADRSAFANFTSELFFLILLPPIILESAFSLHDRTFAANIGTILLYAVVGTILNCFILAPILYGLARAGAMGDISISLVQCFVFSSLIVAVDPVAVLAIFQEIGVNNVLYFLVFGESLLNDAVTVVLYNMMKTFNEMESIPISQMFLGIASFFTISLGGLTIGLFYGALTSFITKYTSKVRVVEPLAIFTLAYASYLSAELFHFSGIISIIACGLVQAQYAFHNISHKSSTTVLYFSKMMSTTSDCIIFMFLGLGLFRPDHVWHTGFVLWTLLLCLLCRFFGVYFLTFLANRLWRLRKIDYEEQFIMAYGGLRGAVAFSLVAMLDKKTLPHQAMFETTTLVVILFTVFIQGITIKPLVKLLRIRREADKVVSMLDEITDHVTDHCMAGIEEVVGYHGHNSFREFLDYYDDRYLKHIFQRCPQTKDDQIMELYEQIALQEHFDNLAGAPDMERYSSQMLLYPIPARQDPDDPFTNIVATTPQLSDQILDSNLHRKSMRAVHPGERWMAVPRIMFGLRSLMSDPGPQSPLTPGTPREPSPDVESGKQRLSLERGRGLSVGTRASMDDEVFVEDPTVDHLRQWLVKNPAKQAYHQKYDRNLLQDERNDLMHHLQEKQRRTARYRRSVSIGGLSPGSSLMHSPSPSPSGSRDALNTVGSVSPRLGTIVEGKPVSARSGTAQGVVLRRSRHRPPMGRALTTDQPPRKSVPQAKHPSLSAAARHAFGKRSQSLDQSLSTSEGDQTVVMDPIAEDDAKADGNGDAANGGGDIGDRSPLLRQDAADRDASLDSGEGASSAKAVNASKPSERRTPLARQDQVTDQISVTVTNTEDEEQALVPARKESDTAV